MKVLILLSWFLPAVLSASVNCGGTYKGFQHTITSPGYPQNYPDKSHCVYVLEGDTTGDCEQEFHLQFLDFEVRGSENCRRDYLQVGDKNVYCGSVFGLRKFTGKNNTLKVIFHSDNQDASKGFKIIVSAVPCTLKLNPLKDDSHGDFVKVDRNKVVEVYDFFRDPYQRGIRQEGDANADNSTTLPILLSNDVSSTSLPESFQLSTRQQEASAIDFSPQDKPGINTPPFSPDAGLQSLGTRQGSDRITSYLFLPPSESNATRFNLIGDKVYEAVTSPPSELLPPSNRPATDFSKSQFTRDRQTALDKSSSLQNNQVQNLATLPARSYGEPGQVGVVDYDLPVTSDCDKNAQHFNDEASAGSDRLNNDPFVSQGYAGGGGFSSSPNFVYDPRYGVVDGSRYPGIGYNPSQSYPSGYNPNSGYNPQINYPGGGYNPGSGVPNYPNNEGYNQGLGIPSYPSGEYNPSYPNGGYNPSVGGSVNPGYSPGYSPTYNPGFVPSYNPNYYPSYGGGGGGDNNLGYGNGLSNGYATQGGECCRISSARRFTIVSPGFPGALSTNNYACRYTVTKFTADVCRLRLVFRFFNFGVDDQFCSYGYVQIDGAKYCGCRTGQSVQVLFTSYIAKPIFVAYGGLPRSRFSGFVIDVIQEPCGIAGFNPSNPSNPSYPFDPNNPYNTGYSGYQNYYQRRRDTSNVTIEDDVVKRSVNSSVIFPSAEDPNPHIRNKRNLGYSYSKPNIPFANKDFPLVSPTAGKQHERFFGGTCESRLFLDWALASKEAILTNQRCVGNAALGFNSRREYLPPSISRASSTCEEINVNQGFLKSPLYPNSYPNNVQKCYRFNKAPNACRLEVLVQDFELEPSQGCAKDYLLFSGENNKYCGRSLSNYKNSFDLTRANFVEVYFTTDSDGTGRGFNIGFTQLPCEVSANF